MMTKKARRTGVTAATRATSRTGAPSVDGRSAAATAREAQITLLKQQLEALEEAWLNLGFRFGMPGEDDLQLENQRGELTTAITDLKRKIANLEASEPMAFPTADQIEKLGRAIDELNARMAAGAAANAIMQAASDVIDAFDL